MIRAVNKKERHYRPSKKDRLASHRDSNISITNIHILSIVFCQ